MQVEKNKQYVVEIIDNGFSGEGIAKIDDFTIFIPNVIKGEIVKIVIVKVLKSYGYGKALEIQKKSENRVDIDCKTYKRCGGCDLRHIKYSETLNIKKNSVQNLVNKGLKNNIKVEDTIGMENPYYYRNKAQYPVGKDKNGKIITGIFANRTHQIIPINECYIQNKESQKIAKFIVDFLNKNNISVYDEKTRKGLIRHIITKIGIKTNEVMCIIVINGTQILKENELVKEITKNFTNVTSIFKNINTKNTNVIMGKKSIKIYGKSYISDKLGDYTFKISPQSFYQINPIQTEKLYNYAVKYAELKKDDIVFDLYCGIGTISIFVSKYVKKVYGVEIVEEAVENAKENSKLNSIKNVEFIAGNVENILDNMINIKKIIPNVIIVDPPRKGLDNTSIKNILKIMPKKLIYISCNPATLIRDLAKFEEKYEISKIQPVDMFPYTHHVENVAVLNKIEA